MRIERYSPRWHDAVIALADRTFGAGYFSRPWEIAQEPGSVMLVCCEGDRELFGFAKGRLLPEGALHEFLEHRVSEVPEDIGEADAKGALGVIQAIAVAPGQRRQGIGTKIVQAMHDALVGQGADKLIVTFKRGASAAKVDGVMRKVGFELWMRLPSYWEPRCDSGEFNCVDRRDNCVCEAVFYRKAVY